jgi:sialate O-acetylesterase
MISRILKFAVALAATLAAASSSLEAKVKLPALVGNGMVLQRDTPLRIWGWADRGEKVDLKFQNKTYSVRADRAGEWSVTLPPLSPGGPFEMTVGDITLRDVMVGDVWLCSGQSNMETFVYRVMDHSAKEIQSFDYPDIRYYRVPTRYVFGEQLTDLSGGEWVAATNDKIAEFSALALFFAREAYDLYGVPVGLIHNAVGGSPIEAWMSPEYIRKYPGPRAQVDLFSRPGYVDSLRRAQAPASAGRPRTNPMNDNDPGVGKWQKPDLDDSDWETMSLPGYWYEKGVEARPGTMWFRREVTLTAAQAAGEATLRMGTIIDSDSTWVNGTFVGNVTYQYPPRIYTFPAGVLKEGRNVIATRVTSNSGRGGFVEEKPYQLIVGRKGGPWGEGGEVIDLAGDWKFRPGAQIAPQPRPQGGQGQAQARNRTPMPNQNSPTGLYNGVMAPLRNYAIKGFLWYQGESNAGRAAEYRDMITDLIEGWRKDWNDPAKPFLFVQLPGMLDAGGWPELRDVQRQTLRLPATGMATTLDVGEWNDIHPQNKKTVAERLFREARRVAYGEKGVSGSGPLFENMTIEGGAAILTFRCEGSDIDPNLRLGGFEIASADGKYVPARAVVLHGNTVKVWSSAVPKPASVRYAWAGDPVGANLRDRDGTPASTFEATTVITADRTGNHDGYDYELWHQRGDVSMTLGPKGTFECAWQNSHNALFRTGKKFYPVQKLDPATTITLDYGCDYRPDGNSYLCVYGWSVDPLVEFYVVESWGNWRPPGARSKKATVTIDGGTYDIYETTRVEMPSIQGTKTFQQYWSVRTDRRTEGTVSMDKHIAAWARQGMRLGSLYEVSLCVEGYESSGAATVYRHDLAITTQNK